MTINLFVIMACVSACGTLFAQNNDIPYEATANVRPWSYRQATNSYLDVSETLRSAMTQNPHLKVNICCGYYDLATPVV